MVANRISNYDLQLRLRTLLQNIKFLCKCSVLLTVTACSASAPRTTTTPNNTPPFPSETHTHEPAPVSAPPTDTLTPILAPTDWRIAEESYSISIKWNEDEIPSEHVALVIPGIDLGFSEWDYPPIFDYLTWSGTRGRLFEIEYNGNLDLEFPSILHLPLAADRYFGFGLGDSLDLTEIYWIDIQTKQVFGYDPPCKSITTVGEDALSIGPEWFAYVCDEDQTTWHLFSLEDTSFTISFQLPFDRSFSKAFEPYWFDSDTLVLDRRGRAETRCIIDLNESSKPIVSCQEFNEDITLGPISPAGKLMEARVSIDTTYLNPQEIGLVDTSCFFTIFDCYLNLHPSPFGPDAGPRGVFLEDSAWLPDSSGILYVQLQSINSAWADKTYIWTFDLHEEIFTEIAYLDDPLVFYQNYNQSAPIWSPDETNVLLQNFAKIYAFDLANATLKILDDQGGIAIGTVALP